MRRARRGPEAGSAWRRLFAPVPPAPLALGLSPVGPYFHPRPVAPWVCSRGSASLLCFFLFSSETAPLPLVSRCRFPASAGRVNRPSEHPRVRVQRSAWLRDRLGQTLRGGGCGRRRPASLAGKGRDAQPLLGDFRSSLNLRELQCWFRDPGLLGFSFTLATRCPPLQCPPLLSRRLEYELGSLSLGDSGTRSLQGRRQVGPTEPQLPL